MEPQQPQGYGPPPGYAQQGYAAPPQKQGTSAGVKLLAAFGLLGLLGMGTCATCAVIGAGGAAKAVSDANNSAARAAEARPLSAPAAAAAPAEPAERVDVKVLLSEYKDNEVRADGVFKGKRLRVEGKVGDIKKDILNHPYVTVGTGQMFEIPTVQCMLEDSQVGAAAQLSKGAKVTIEGTVKGLMMNVLIDDCVIAN